MPMAAGAAGVGSGRISPSSRPPHLLSTEGSISQPLQDAGGGWGGPDAGGRGNGQGPDT